MMANLTIEEKRLQAIKFQLFGKEEGARLETKSQEQLFDLSFLKNDLRKILTLSFLSLSFQIALYYLMKNHFLNFKF